MRKATPADIEQIVKWGREFHAESPYSAYPYSPERVGNLIAHMIDNACVLISDTGMAGAIKVPLWFSEVTYGQEMFWWGDSSLREGLEEWAKDEGCIAFNMMCLENEKAPVLARLYRMNGFKMTEHHFMKAL